jgi:hypothetical protein
VNTALQKVFPNGELNRVVDEIAERRQDPYSVVEQIIKSSTFGRS